MSLFVKVMVMDLMMSSYKGTWTNSDLWHFTPGKKKSSLNSLFCFCRNTIFESLSIFTYRSEEVVAVASMNYDPIVSRVAEVLGSGKTIKKRDVE